MDVQTPTSGDDLVAIARVRRLAATGEAQQIRKAARVSRAEMADVLGCTPRALWEWESGNRVPRTRIALRWARALDRLAEWARAAQ